MKTNTSASMEAKIKNSKELLVTLKDMTQYDPTAEDIKIENYNKFVDDANTSLTPLKETSGRLVSAKKRSIQTSNKLLKTCRTIRSEMKELKGSGAEETERVNSVIKLITGENIAAHTKMKKKVLANLKEGEPTPTFSSVSALDQKSQLGNFRTLIGILKTFDFYTPNDNAISIESLKLLEAELESMIELVAEMEIDYATERSKVIHYFVGPYGLKQKATRAKVHVGRKYGLESPEYKLLVNRRF